MATDCVIVDLRGEDAGFIRELAELTYTAFRETSPNWLPTVDAATEELRESLEPGRRSRVLVSAANEPLGWIGTIPQSGGRVWEIHPIVVGKKAQGRGHGRLLVEDVERLAGSAGALTLFAGTGDEMGRTSLSGVDLYADPLAAMAAIRCEGPHAYKFWLSVGFSIVGVMPDAEGIGRHGIHLAKSLAGDASRRAV